MARHPPVHFLHLRPPAPGLTSKNKKENPVWVFFFSSSSPAIIKKDSPFRALSIPGGREEREGRKGKKNPERKERKGSGRRGEGEKKGRGKIKSGDYTKGTPLPLKLGLNWGGGGGGREGTDSSAPFSKPSPFKKVSNSCGNKEPGLGGRRKRGGEGKN